MNPDGYPHACESLWRLVVELRGFGHAVEQADEPFAGALPGGY